jgi:hypothetical protein
MSHILFITIKYIKLFETRVEAGSNTSTVALRIVGGDEMGTQYLGLNWTSPLGDINTGA